MVYLDSPSSPTMSLLCYMSCGADGVMEDSWGGRVLRFNEANLG